MRTNQTDLPLVGGEPARALAKALTEVDVTRAASGGCRVNASFDAATGAPLFRAILRIEAELLLADADLLSDFDRQLRTEAQLRADAFVLLARRVADAIAG